MQETWVQSLGWEDPLEKEMATHSSTLAWRIPRREEPCRLQSMGLQRVRHDWVTSLSLWCSAVSVALVWWLPAWPLFCDNGNSRVLCSRLFPNGLNSAVGIIVDTCQSEIEKLSYMREVKGGGFSSFIFRVLSSFCFLPP